MSSILSQVIKVIFPSQVSESPPELSQSQDYEPGAMASASVSCQFCQQLGKDTVNITVGSGPREKAFTVRKSILCKKVPFFAAMFNGGFLEAKTQSAKLPEDDARAFEYFLGWLYQDTIGKLDSIAEHMALLGFAEKYNLLPLMDLTMDSMMSLMNRNKQILGMSWIERAYGSTHEKSKLREFAVSCYVWVLLVGNVTKSSAEDWLPKGQDPDQILIDCFRVQRNFQISLTMPRSGGNLFPDPRKAPPCHFHSHEDPTLCPNRSTVERKVAEKTNVGKTFAKTPVARKQVWRP
ncbi:uncharacterized protein RSE6_03790 [Rhynchosporium secalis]|uniref:BTB domain-containing protein n=1 Tax=Rhynchosporium secalis TaxID=38038 RepID=A0A1E1M3P4_RHYSE|nr:uncharacterized protein RSE6_03790 [Rhynchosporium secalis]